MKAIVTGHTRGLGEAVAAQLLAHGFDVLGLARARNPALAAQYPAALSQVALDLGDAGALARWLRGEALADFLADATQVVLVNNAGTVQPVAALDSQDGAELAAPVGAAVTLNVAAPLMLAGAFVAASKAVADRRIVHISSGAARGAYPGWSVYGACKAALDHHARTVALEADQQLPPTLRICSLAPGVIDTDMQAEIRAARETDFPMRPRFEALKRDGHLSTPQACAQQLVDYLLSDAFGSAAVADLRQLG